MNRIKDIYRRLAQKKYVNSLTVTAVIALLINLIIETAARHSLVQALVFAFTSPLVFLIQCLHNICDTQHCMSFQKKSICIIVHIFCMAASGYCKRCDTSKENDSVYNKRPDNAGDGFSILPTYLTNFEIVLLAIAGSCSNSRICTAVLSRDLKKEKKSNTREI